MWYVRVFSQHFGNMTRPLELGIFALFYTKLGKNTPYNKNKNKLRAIPEKNTWEGKTAGDIFFFGWLVRKVFKLYGSKKKKTFCGFPWVETSTAGRVYDLCVYYMTGAPEGSPKVVLCGFMVFMEKPGIEPATPGLQGIVFDQI